MAIENRYDFIMLFDVENGNPNGDPDAGNAPRVDVETNHGFITDVCLKRKVRNYIELTREGEAGYNILIKADRALNSKFAAAYEENGMELGKKGKNTDDVKAARDFMCKNYFDVRAFGAVMSTGDNPCGIVRGPVQLTFARSVSPVSIQEVSITRQARTTEERTKTGDTEMGRKSVIPYALYRGEGFVSAALNNKLPNGLSEEDLKVLWEAIINMFEHDHSAARGKMCMRKLYVFKHDNVLGECPAQVLFDKIAVKQLSEIPPRSFTDYEISVDKDLPVGVEILEML